MSEPRNPWLEIPLGDYESHMEEVKQSDLLSEVFRQTLMMCRPRSVAVLGVAGGNGLEHIDPSVTKRVVGLDVNPSYLRSVRDRYEYLPGLELHQVDLSADALTLPPVDLVYAGLIFEHAGVDRCLENALSLVSPGGSLSVVLQLSYGGENVKRTPTVRAHIGGSPLEFSFIDPARLQTRLEERGLVLVLSKKCPIPIMSEFWAAIFASASPRPLA